jgi:uncharacterized membrane protein
MDTFYKILGLAGAAFMMCGAWLQWSSDRLKSDIEEDEKDEKISKDVARRRIRLVALWPQLIGVLGIVLVLVAVIKLLS